MSLLCQICCEVPPRLYVLETVLFVPFSTELQGVCWIWGLFSSLVLHFESLAPALKDAVKHRINIELFLHPHGLRGSK